MTCLKWTPDGTALAMTWSLGGFSLWSTFGSMIMCSLCWDYGIHVSDPVAQNPVWIEGTIGLHLSFPLTLCASSISCWDVSRTLTMLRELGIPWPENVKIKKNCLWSRYGIHAT